MEKFVSMQDFIKAMNDLMITSVSQKSMLDIAYCILLLNQIRFINDKSLRDSNITVDRASLPFIKIVCEILDIDSKDVLEYLMTSTITAHNKTFKQPHVHTDGAYKKVQTFCCILYNCITDWIFAHIHKLCLQSIRNDNVSH